MSNNKDTNQQAQKGPKLFTRNEAETLGNAVARWHELRDNIIKTPTSDAELKGLTEFIATQAVEHIDELIGCWFTIRDEYEPILNLISRVGQRVNSINAQYYARMQAAYAAANPEQPKQEAANVVALNPESK